MGPGLGEQSPAKGYSPRPYFPHRVLTLSNQQPGTGGVEPPWTTLLAPPRKGTRPAQRLWRSWGSDLHSIYTLTSDTPDILAAPSPLAPYGGELKGLTPESGGPLRACNSECASTDRLVCLLSMYTRISAKKDKPE